MTVYRNGAYTGRNYECTNIVACEAETPPKGDWQAMGPEAGDLVKRELTQLWIEAGVTYYGHM